MRKEDYTKRIMLLMLILSVLVNFELLAQNKVSGTVSGADSNDGLPGVTIIEKGTSNGVVSDIDGNFSIVVEPTAILEISFIGYVKQEVIVGSRTTLNVIMEVDILSLEEVIVVGYGSQKKKDFTGSVVAISSEDFNKGVNASMDQLMIGKVAGVAITQTSSEPGGGMSIRIRGANSVNSDTQPLYVIDGFPVSNTNLDPQGSSNGRGSNTQSTNPLSTINPSDIESISILKDASASAIYGSRAANGVVIVTTKRGRSGKPTLTYNVFTGVSTPVNKVDLMTGPQYAAYINSIDEAAGNPLTFDPNETVGNTDWQDVMIGQGKITSHDISLTGGSDQTKYFFSTSYYDEEGVIDNADFSRVSFKANIDQKLSDKFNLGFNLNTSYTESARLDFGDNFEGNNLMPKIYNADPTISSERDPATGEYPVSPVQNVAGPVSATDILDNTRTLRLLPNLRLEYQATPDLRFTAKAGMDYGNAKRDNYRYKRNGGAGSANISHLLSTSYLVEGIVDYAKTFGESSLKLTAATSFQKFNKETFRAGASEFTTDFFETNNLGAGATVGGASSYKSPTHEIQSFMLRANYSLKDKYLVTVTGRADGSTKFAQGNKWGFFPSAALGWIISEESILSGSSVLNHLKLRTSYGVTGNERIPSGEAYPRIAAGGEYQDYSIDGQTASIGYGLVNLGNPELGWEKVSQLDIGLEFGFFDGRVSGEFDYYNKVTSDLILPLPLPGSLGLGISNDLPTQMTNWGEITNSGLELALNTENFVGAFKWNTQFNISFNGSEITDLKGLEIPPVQRFRIGNGGTAEAINPIEVGLGVGEIWGYEYLGVANVSDTIAYPGITLGAPMYADINGDTLVNEDDKVKLGNSLPSTIIGFTNTFSYKGFDLSILFQGAFGHHLLNASKARQMGGEVNQVAIMENRWSEENTNTDIPQYGFLGQEQNGGSWLNSYFVEKADYLRLKNVTIGYNFDMQNVQFMSGIRIYVSGTNLHTWTNYSGLDPEVSSRGAAVTSSGIDLNAYPTTKSYNVGVQVKF